MYEILNNPDNGGNHPFTPDLFRVDRKLGTVNKSGLKF